MTSISEMIIRNKLSRESLQQAEQWAVKGLEVVVTTRKASKEPIAICEVAYAVQLFNMASLRAVSSSGHIVSLASHNLTDWWRHQQREGPFRPCCESC